MLQELTETFEGIDRIEIRGAREHNLKNISLSIPRDQFVVITGVSGSGKSTLAFDLLFAEGQRRFLDAMNAYARQFVEQMARPDVDLIAGIPPTVSIEQRTSRGGGKSTVATVTEIYQFLRLLFARMGVLHCPDCELPVTDQTEDSLWRGLAGEVQRRGRLTVLAPVVRGRKGYHSEVAEWAARHGYERVRADGEFHDTDKPLRLDRFREHHVEVVIGELKRERKGGVAREARALMEAALDVGEGNFFALDGAGKLTVHSTRRTCPGCGKSYGILDPKNFSYNSPAGWCPTCRGFGETFYLPDVERGARADSVEESWFEWQEGEREVCGECEGSRLNKLARSVRLAWPGKGKLVDCTIEGFGRMTVNEAWQRFESVQWTEREGEIARDIVPEIRERLRFLAEVGLEYVHLGRSVTTLSGGEAQRIRLAAQLGSNLSGVLYVLDEPTIGLHSRDNQRLLQALGQLRERGNSVVVVEHDEETMRAADHIIDLGPGAGVEGGRVIAEGSLVELMRNPESVTGQALREKRHVPARGERRPVGGKERPEKENGPGRLTISGAKMHNLKDVHVSIPLGRLVVVTGVSGSGKSTLVRECLLPGVTEALARKRKGSGKSRPAGESGRGQVEGAEALQAVYEVDQSPIGRTPRSIPATYVGFFDSVRQVFAQTSEARLRGFGANRFSFNSAAGRCATCEGAGTIKLEMNFMPPAYVRCETCQGSRYNSETLEVRYRGRTIAEVLELSVKEALEVFGAHPKIRRALEALSETGLDYLKLGQISPTLSGGEAQRIKLVSHLLAGLKQDPTRQGMKKKNLFILEEPTIGLHMKDVRRLVDVLQQLVDGGHSVVVIEHNLDLIAEADWLVDLGPEAGDRGGRVLCEGTPEKVARSRKSHTGRFLEELLDKARGGKG